jgi:hypothetical protein
MNLDRGASISDVRRAVLSSPAGGVVVCADVIVCPGQSADYIPRRVVDPKWNSDQGPGERICRGLAADLFAAGQQEVFDIVPCVNRLDAGFVERAEETISNMQAHALQCLGMDWHAGAGTDGVHALAQYLFQIDVRSGVDNLGPMNDAANDCTSSRGAGYIVNEAHEPLTGGFVTPDGKNFRTGRRRPSWSLPSLRDCHQ